YAAVALAAFIHHLVAAGEALDLLGDEAAVEGIPRPLDLLLAAAAAAFGLADDTPPCARQRLIAEKLACLRHPSARCIESGGGGPLALEELLQAGDCVCHARQKRMAFFGIVDRWGEHIGEGQGAEIAEQLHPGVESARNDGSEQAI